MDKNRGMAGEKSGEKMELIKKKSNGQKMIDIFEDNTYLIIALGLFFAITATPLASYAFKTLLTPEILSYNSVVVESNITLGQNILFVNYTGTNPINKTPNFEIFKNCKINNIYLLTPSGRDYNLTSQYEYTQLERKGLFINETACIYSPSVFTTLVSSN